MIAVIQFGDWGVEASEAVELQKQVLNYSAIYLENYILNNKNLEINFHKCFI